QSISRLALRDALPVWADARSRSVVGGAYISAPGASGGGTPPTADHSVSTASVPARSSLGRLALPVRATAMSRLRIFADTAPDTRSEEHTSELQSRENL